MVVVQENARQPHLIGGATPGQASEALDGIVANARRRIAIQTEIGDLSGAQQISDGLQVLLASYEATGRIETEPMGPESRLGNIATVSTAGRVE